MPALPDCNGDAPRPPETVVPRHRLYELLDVASRCPVTMIVSPAGTGKTTLMAAWAERQREADPQALHWVSAHQHKALERCLLQSAGVDATSAHQLTSEHLGESRDTCAWLLPPLEQAIDGGNRPQLIVIDDAHQLPPAQVKSIAGILAKRPDVVRLLLASRRDLPFSHAELEMRGLAHMFRAGDLAFDGEEARDLIRAHARDAAEADIELLQERTGGWAAALVLGARTLMSRSHVDGQALLGGTDGPVLDFLLNEVFTTLPTKTRRILLSTFNESVVTPERAAVLSGNDNAGAVLSELANDGVLVNAYVNDRSDVWFKYHPLLVEMLRRQVVDGKGAASVVTVAQQRAALHEAAQSSDSAQTHGIAALKGAIEGRDPNHLAELIVEHGPTLLCAGQEDVVATMLAALPPNALDRFPQLLGVAALHRRTTGDVAGAVRLSGRASEAVESLGSAPSTSSPMDVALRTDALLMELWQSRFGWHDARSAMAGARIMLSATDEDSATGAALRPLAVNPSRLSWLMIELAAVELWTGDLTSATTHVNEAVVSARAVGHKRLLAAALSHRALIELARGETQSAASTAEEALSTTPAGDEARVAFLDQARVALGWAAFFRLDLVEARRSLAELDASPAVKLDALTSVYATMLRAALLTEAGRIVEAQRVLAAGPEACAPLPVFVARALALLRWRCAELLADVDLMASQETVLEAAGFGVEVDMLRACEETMKGDKRPTTAKIKQLVDALTPTDAIFAATGAAAGVVLALRAGDRSSAMVHAVNRLFSSCSPKKAKPMTGIPSRRRH
jgi:ATP/maltotriose-dependent transcriptional regulator MalT